MGSVRISSEDAAALTLLANGKTLVKISKASRAKVTVDELNLVMEITGTLLQRRRAKKYVDCFMKHRTGRFTITDDDDDSDLTRISVPADVVGYVQGG